LFDWMTSPEAWVAFATLTVLEIILGIDNIIFISILAGKLPAALQARARTIGLMLAMVTRLLLLASIAWIARLTTTLFTVAGQDISGRDLVLLGGGLFLLYKATREIHEKLEGHDHEGVARTPPSFAAVIAQILLIDLVFSLDSVITAVGMVDDLGVMVSAVVVTVLIMLVAAGPISAFVNRHPTVKMLALAFLLLIGVVLVAEGLEFHLPKGYIYTAMAFAVAVEMLNLRTRRGRPVKFNEPRAVAEAPHVLPAAALVSIEIQPGARAAGQDVTTLTPGARVILIRRGGGLLVPAEGVTLQPGDALDVVGSAEEVSQFRALVS